MEEKRPELVRRPVSFNPKAAAFNPSTLTTSPRQTAGIPGTSQNESPFRPAPEMRPIYYEESDKTSGSQSNGPQSDPLYLALDDIRDMIRALDQAQNEARSNVFPVQSINTAVPYQSFSAPEVDELTKTLGLPSVVRKDETSDVDSPVSPPDPTNSKDDTKSDRRGQLVRALDKPFTANMLVDYLSSKGVPNPTATTRPSHISNDLGTQPERKSGEDSPTRTKIVQPPPGFIGERPRIIHTEQQTPTSPIVPVRKPTPTGPSRPIPTGPANFGRARRFSELQPANAAPQIPHHHTHYHVPGSRRNTYTRPRASTRTKRIDQGPEPSAADIYPDDAVYMSPLSSRRPSQAADSVVPFPDFTITSPRQPTVQDPTLWPTPAEVYASKPSSFTTINPPPLPTNNAATTTTHQRSTFSSTTTTDRAPFDLFADHYPPTTADILATDAHVDALLLLTPYLFALDTPDAVPCPERPLTPHQLDGTRYGLRFYGLGLGDGWKGAVVGGKEEEEQHK